MAKRSGLTKEKLEVYRVLGNIIIQLFYAVGIFGVLVWALTKLFDAPSEDQWKFLILDGIFAFTLYRIVRYYFPIMKNQESKQSTIDIR